MVPLLLVLLLAVAQAQQPFPDIPPGHWAEEAVGRIAELGIITGFPTEPSGVTRPSPAIRQHWL